MTWKFRGSSNGADQLTAFDRKGTCLACHINGAPIMKELLLPWNNWHSFMSGPSYLLRTTPVGQRWPVVVNNQFDHLTSAQNLEVSILAAIRQFNTRRINTSLKREDATGNIETAIDGRQTIIEGKRLLRHLFETTEINIISATELSAFHPLGPPVTTHGRFQIPSSFFLNSNLIGGGGFTGYNGIGLEKAREFSTIAKASIKGSEYKDAVARLGLKILGRAGDANFAWLVPEPSHIDNHMVDQLIDRGIVPGQFVAAVQAIDLRNPVLSDDRATILKYIPDRFSFKPISTDERLSFDHFALHELTKLVIAAIEADGGDADPPAREFLGLLKTIDETSAPIMVLEERVANYIEDVKIALNNGDSEARKKEVDILLNKADQLRKSVLEDETLGGLDETGGFSLFPLK